TAMAAPRAKPAAPPAYPPAPRSKPVVEVAAPVAVVAPVAAVAPSAPIAPAACGEACPPILFKVFDGCLWGVNLNPRPVAFQAEVGGKRIALALEAADGEKADAFAASAAQGKVAKDIAGVHMRFRDPFQSAGSGIPLYRARLGAVGACAKSRD